MTKHHDWGNLQKEEFIGLMVPEGQSPSWPGGTTAGRHGGWGRKLSELSSSPANMKQIKQPRSGRGCPGLSVGPQEYTCSKGAPLNLLVQHHQLRTRCSNVWARREQSHSKHYTESSSTKVSLWQWGPQIWISVLTVTKRVSLCKALFCVSVS